MLSILLLMGFCGAIAWLLSHELGIDPLTAYLATSPGGLDSVAIIATGRQQCEPVAGHGAAIGAADLRAAVRAGAGRASSPAAVKPLKRVAPNRPHSAGPVRAKTIGLRLVRAPRAP